MSKLIQIVKVEKHHQVEVAKLLHKNMSKFLPHNAELSSIWWKYIKQPSVRALVIIENNKIIGFGSLMIEIKIRGGKMGHIEDIVIDQNKQGSGLGKLLIEKLLEIAKKEKCYKLSLQCQEHNVKFYEKCRFEKSGINMQFFINKI